MKIFIEKDNYIIFEKKALEKFFVRMKNKNSLEEEIFTSSDDAIEHANAKIDK